MNQIPHTLIGYSQTSEHHGVTVYRADDGWKVPVDQSANDDIMPVWLATYSTLDKARGFIDRMRAEGRSHIFHIKPEFAAV